MKIKLRFDNSDTFSGRFYFYKDLITLRIGKNLTFPCVSKYLKKVKLHNYSEVFWFILFHELAHKYQFENKLKIDERSADIIAYEIVRTLNLIGGNMKKVKTYACGGGGAAGGGRSGRSGGRRSSKKSTTKKSRRARR